MQRSRGETQLEEVWEQLELGRGQGEMRPEESPTSDLKGPFTQAKEFELHQKDRRSPSKDLKLFDALMLRVGEMCIMRVVAATAVIKAKNGRR